MNNSIPRRLQVLLSKLNFLSQITRGYKPCVNNMTLIDASSWYGAFQRSWNGESRKSLIAAVEQIVGETVEAINEHADDDFLLKLIINALPKSREGIDSLKITYKDDPEIISRVEVQLTSLDLQLDKFRALIKGYETPLNLSSSINETNNVSEDIEDFVRGNPISLKSSTQDLLSMDNQYPSIVRRKRRSVKKSTE